MLKKQSAQQTVGNWAEGLAKEFLLAKGLKLISTQFRTQLGEIDLIMFDQKKKTLVFVEVRYRKNVHFGTPLETISTKKRQCLIRTAQCFIKYQKWTAHFACRFDVVSILGNQLTPKITWIQNAFGVQ